MLYCVTIKLTSFRIVILSLFFSWALMPYAESKCPAVKSTEQVVWLLGSDDITKEQVSHLKELTHFIKKKPRSKATESSLQHVIDEIVNIYNYSIPKRQIVVRPHIFPVAESNRKRGPPAGSYV
jgi:hypothetical protein